MWGALIRKRVAVDKKSTVSLVTNHRHSSMNCPLESLRGLGSGSAQGPSTRRQAKLWASRNNPCFGAVAINMRRLATTPYHPRSQLCLIFIESDEIMKKRWKPCMFAFFKLLNTLYRSSTVTFELLWSTLYYLSLLYVRLSELHKCS